MTTLNGQVIGQAQRAIQALLDRLLVPAGVTFEQSVALNVAATQGGGRPEIEARLRDGLRVDPATAARIVDEVVGAGLLDGTGALTSAGQARHGQISAGIAGLTERLYGNVPAEDLAVAGRVLTELTARARAELSTVE